MTYFSVVVPVYYGENSTPELYKRLSHYLQEITNDYEILFVEDHSPDGSWESILALSKLDSRVKGLKLSRNFGQMAAIDAGLNYASGEYVVVMDCDLQDDPKYIPSLYMKAKEGYDIVHAAKAKRQFGFFKNFCAKAYTILFNFLSDTGSSYHEKMGGFSLVKKKVVEAYKRIGDTRKHYSHSLSWLGFKKASVPVDHQNRFDGKSSYSFFALVKHGLNGLISQSSRLLYLGVVFGFLNVLLSFLGVFYVCMTYFHYKYLPGWASLIVTVLWSTGIILLSLGVMGIYLARTFEQAKGLPSFVVEDTLNFVSEGKKTRVLH